MIYEDFKVHAEPYFSDMRCPKHRIAMFEFDNGMFAKGWFCPKCKAPYSLYPVKMKKWDKKALEQALLDKKNGGL